MDHSKYSLRQIVDMTGLSEFTLRGWELRYSAFKPYRTTTGRRQYSNQDLQKALLLRELVGREHRIGDIASLKIAELKKMMAATSVVTPSDEVPSNVKKVMKHVALQEWDDLEEQISKNVKALRPLKAIREFVIPLFRQMSIEVAKGRLSIAQEHILSSILKQQLHILSQPSEKTSTKRFLIAAPEGDFHELGILSAHAIISQLKIRSLFLGPNTPKKELCETALRLGATHILLGATITKKEGAKEDFYTYVNFLDQNLPKKIQFWLAGRAAGAIHLKREVVYLTSLQELEEKFI